MVGSKKRFNSAHPSLKVFVRALKMEQAKIDYFIDRVKGNDEPPQKRPKKSHDELIKVASDFKNYVNIKDYMFDLVKIIGFPVKK